MKKLHSLVQKKLHVCASSLIGALIGIKSHVQKCFIFYARQGRTVRGLGGLPNPSPQLEVLKYF